MSDLFDDESDPFDDPRMAEAIVRAAGYTHPRAGYVGFPEEWLERVLPLMRSAQQLAVALLMFRHLGWTVPLPMPDAEIEALGIDRRAKYYTLDALERAGLIQVERRMGARSRVRLMWVPCTSGRTPVHPI